MTVEKERFGKKELACPHCGVFASAVNYNAISYLGNISDMLELDNAHKQSLKQEIEVRLQ